MQCSLIGSRAPDRTPSLAFREILPQVAGPGLADRACAARPADMWALQRIQGHPSASRTAWAEGSWKCFAAGPMLNVPQATRYEAGSTVGGRNGRTDGEVSSCGVASWCRGRSMIRFLPAGHAGRTR
jgi:hypothetical protein